MSKLYDRIEYVGICKSYTIEIFPTRKRITISKDHPYKFEDKDSQDERSINYYKSMSKHGVKLIPIDNLEDQNIDQTPTVTNKIEVIPQESVQEVHVDEVYEEVKEEVKEEVSKIKEKTVIADDAVEVNNIESTATESEMLEFLDLAYDDESIKSVAKDAGLKRIGSSDKATIMNKMIENNPEYVVNLMKNNS